MFMAFNTLIIKWNIEECGESYKKKSNLKSFDSMATYQKIFKSDPFSDSFGFAYDRVIQSVVFVMVKKIFVA
jgi:hypothetical protein